MTRQHIIEACAAAILASYDPYELADNGATWHELHGETVRLLETNPRALLEYLKEIA